ncbi:serine hydrolase domain-containing protein [Ekhidna sp.]|uniref:serine hydrolase domain-containing protein n=1 Tax=Ekhidna sp. TaxID=2608089 RepID=UPI003C799F35
MKNLTLILLLAMITCCSSPEQSQENSLLTRLDSIGESFIKKNQVLGISVAIMQKSDTLYTKGFGYTDLEQTKPVTNQSRFLMASVSKLIGAVIVMKLVDEDKLSLNDTLINLLPDFPNKEQGQTITLRHLLSHTSGLPDYASEIDSAYVKTGQDPYKNDIYTFLKDRSQIFEAGSDYSYCNTGFYLMGLIVEKITGNTFQQEVDRIINQPTGINLELIATAKSDPEMSPYWELKDQEFISYPHWTWIKGDGGLTATSIMLAQFPNKWANGRIISPESYQAMTTPIILNNGIQTGYGIGVRNGEFIGERIIGHTGGHKSTYSIMVYFPDRDLTFVVFINTDNSVISVREIFAEYARVVLDKEIPNYATEEIPPIDLTMYEGTYRNFDHKMNNITTIKLVGNNLHYCMGDDCVKMYYQDNHQFWIPEWPYDFVDFHVNQDDEVLAIKEYYTGFYSVLRQRIPDE